MGRWVSLVILAAIVIVTAGMFAWVMAQFVLPIFLALVLVVLFRPMHLFFAQLAGNRVRVGAALTTLATLLIVLVPAILLFSRAASDGLRLAAGLNRTDFSQVLDELRETLGLSLPPVEVRTACDRLSAQLGQLRAAATAGPAEDSAQADAAPAAAAPEAAAAGAATEAPAPSAPPAAAGPDISEPGTAPQATSLPDAAPGGAMANSVSPPPETPPARMADLPRIVEQFDQEAQSLGLKLRKLAAEMPPPSDPKRLQAREAHDRQVNESLRALVARIEVFAPLAVAHAAPAQPGVSPPPDSTVAAEAQAAFDRALREVERAYDQFREALFGDPFLHWLRIQANPESDSTRLEQVRAFLQNNLQPLAVSTTQYVAGFLGKFVVGLAIMLISLYYFLADGPAMVDTVMRLSPLDRRYEEQMLREFDKVSRAVVMATLLSAVVQGLLAAIGFAVAGVGTVVLLSVVSMILAMVPFVGAASVWGSVAVWLLVFEHRPWAAGLLALYGTTVISTADNVIKPFVLHGQSNIHPLMALLSVLGGVATLGPIGIFVGPMVVAFLHALLLMLQAELSALSGPGDPPAAPAEKPGKFGRKRR